MKYVFTSDIDNLIKKAYIKRKYISDGSIKALSKEINISKGGIRERAIKLGAWQVRIKDKPWSKEEVGILEHKSYYGVKKIQTVLKRHGYIRTLTAIQAKVKRLHLRKDSNGGYSATQLAVAFGAESHIISKWIKEGLLKAIKRGTSRVLQQGGDEYYIKDEWVRDFIIKNIGIIDHRKIDKYWLVDILSNSYK